MAEVSKTFMPVMFGPPDSTAAVTKVVMYVLLEPGGYTPPTPQGHVFSQAIRI